MSTRNGRSPGMTSRNGGPFSPSNSQDFLSDFKNLGPLRPDDDRLNAAASHSGFGAGDPLECMSAYERMMDLSWTSRHVRDGPLDEVAVHTSDFRFRG